MNDEELDRCENPGCTAVLQEHEAGICDACDYLAWDAHWEREAMGEAA